MLKSPSFERRLGLVSAEKTAIIAQSFSFGGSGSPVELPPAEKLVFAAMGQWRIAEERELPTTVAAWMRLGPVLNEHDARREAGGGAKTVERLSCAPRAKSPEAGAVPAGCG